MIVYFKIFYELILVYVIFHFIWHYLSARNVPAEDGRRQSKINNMKKRIFVFNVLISCAT